MNAGAAARRPSARLWRITAGTVAGLLIVAALAITVLRLALYYLPGHATRLQSWIERETHMRIEYSHLDARLRWYGPELVLRDVRVLDRDGSQALFMTREGSVGLDVWNLFRTGQLIAGRVRFVAPRVTVVRLEDGSIRLLGQREWPADRPPFDLDRLPAGRLVIEDATVIYRDLQRGLPPLQLDDLDVDLSRDRGFVIAEGAAQLPESLGTDVEFSARLKGSLEEAKRLDARLEVRIDELRLAGLQHRLPATMARPLSGRGSARVVIATTQGTLRNARIDYDLQDVHLRLPPRVAPPIEAVQVSSIRLVQERGRLPYPTVILTHEARTPTPLPTDVRYALLQGNLKLRNEAGAWTFEAQDVRADPAAKVTPRRALDVGSSHVAKTARVVGHWRGDWQATFEMDLEADAVDVPAVWPLALAFAPRNFDRWAGLAPVGKINSLRVKASRERAGLAPNFTVAADVAGLGLQPHERLPGISGITARLRGTDHGGTLQLRAVAPDFDWPRLFRAPIKLQRVTADLGWKRDGEAWVVRSRNTLLEHAQARASVNFELTFLKPDVSPVLNMSATVDDIDVTSVPQFLPVGRLRERTIAWLDGAFKHGRATNGKLSYRGPVRKFPFREGEGEFTATVDTHDITLDYYPGFAPLTGASGTAQFHNAGIGANVDAGKIAGLQLAGADFAIADYKFPVLDIAGSGIGDVGGALKYVQQSPLGPRLGTVFMGLSGAGPARYHVRLSLPIIAPTVQAPAGTPRKMDYHVRADLDSVTVATPILRAPAQKVTGIFSLHNQEVTLQGVRGTILDGPFELTAEPGTTSRDVPVVVDFTAHGTAGGANLPAFIGLPPAIRMAGSTPWELRGRVEKHDDAARWPVQINVNSTLTGLDVFAPKPFAKPAGETRPTRVRLDIPGNRLNDIAVESGTARARLRFAERDGKWRFDRGAARFDAQAVTLPAQPGMFVTGNWPDFDLAEWLSLRRDAGAPGSGTGGDAGNDRLSDWLGPVDVHLDNATVVGYGFSDLAARLRLDGDTWRIAVDGPGAEGLVSVPDNLRDGKPIVLEMKRLFLVANEGPKGGDGVARPAEPETDPRRLPSITVRADDFAWQGRRFGHLQAAFVQDPRGLVFQTLATTAPEFTIAGEGSWFVENGATRTRVELDLDSTDFGATARALGYRDSIDARKAHFTANLNWPGGPSADVLAKVSGALNLSLEDGQLRDVEPGAGRMLGLLSVAQLPRRLALDFHDVTDKGLAFDKVQGTFDLHDGNAHTQDLLLKGPAVDIGVVGRTGLASEDYDQTVVVSGNPGGPLIVAGALAGGPVGAASVLLLSQMFKGQLQGLTRAYYHVTGPWASPVVERISASASGENAPGETATLPVAGGQP